VEEAALPPRREGFQPAKAEGHGPLVGGHDVHTAAERPADVVDRRPPVPRVERRDLDEDVGRHPRDEGPRAAQPRATVQRLDRATFATSRSARPRAIPRPSTAIPCRAVAIPVTRTRAPSAFSARA